MNNLDCNPTSPFTRYYESKDDHLDCVNSGLWYRRAYGHCCTTSSDMLVPIIFTFDESVLANQHAQIAPLKFTTSLLNQAARNKESAWCTLHFVYDTGCLMSKAEAAKEGAPMACTHNNTSVTTMSKRKASSRNATKQHCPNPHCLFFRSMEMKSQTA